MDEEKFWIIVEQCHAASNGDMDRQDSLIKSAVSGLTSKDAEAFDQIFRQMMDAAYTWPLWGAAYVINGGCGDDSFSDFRASLIARGRAAFGRALAEPDSMADDEIDIDCWFHEGIEYAVTEGAIASLGKRPDRRTAPREPVGERWEERNVYELYPKLARKVASF